MAAQRIEKRQRSGLLDPHILHPADLDPNAMTAEHFLPSLQKPAALGIPLDKHIHAARVRLAPDRIPFARAGSKQHQT
jgi:hypothetical protein